MPIKFKYKWLVVVASFGLHYISLGIVQGFGIIYSELLDQFGTGKGETGWIPSLGSGLLLGFGPISSVMIKLIGCRSVAIMGSILISLGMVSSMFVQNVYELYLTYGIIAGVGNGMVFHSAIVAVNGHFKKKCKMALTMLTVGSPASLLTTPFLTTIWIGNYGWRGTFLLLAGISIQGVVCGALFRPFDTSSQDSTQTPVKLTSIKAELKAIFSISDFVLFCVYSSFGTLGYMIPYVMVPAMAAEKGISALDIPFITTTAGVFGIIARTMTGIMVHKEYVNVLVLHGTALMIGSIFTAACAYFSSYVMFLVYGGVLGMFTGIFGALLSVITVDIVGKSNLNLAFGTLSFFHGLTFTIGTPIAGWVADASGGYEEALYLACVVFAIGSIMSFSIYIRRKRHAKSLRSLINQRTVQTRTNPQMTTKKVYPFPVQMVLNAKRGVARRLSTISGIGAIPSPIP